MFIIENIWNNVGWIIVGELVGATADDVNNWWTRRVARRRANYAQDQGLIDRQGRP